MNQRYACPGCEATDGLWEGVTIEGAWRDVDAELNPTDRPETEDGDARPDGTYGCGHCSWTGVAEQLLRIGNDGNPLPMHGPDQGTLTLPASPTTGGSECPATE